MDANGVPEVDLAYFGTADPRAYGIKFRKVALVFDFYPELEVVRPQSGRYLAVSVTLLAGVNLSADRDFAREVVRRGFATRSAIDQFLSEHESRRQHRLPIVHLSDWLLARGLITADQRRMAEDPIPAAWLARVRDTLPPIAWAGDSIAIYRIP
jgi:hypothetical protein